MVKRCKDFYAALSSKLWLRLFARMGLIFVVFVLVLTLCNTAFLTGYYEYVKKQELQSAGAGLRGADISNTAETVELISDIQEDYGFEIEVYTESGKTLYSTSGGQMMDFFFQKNDRLNMNHLPLDVLDTKQLSDDSKMLTALDRMSGKEYFVYQLDLGDGNTGEVRIQRSVIENSAQIANGFITFIAVVILVIALVWVFWFSRSVSKPITQMNIITRKMADLDFSKKLVPDSADEIGQLAVSINELSGKLDGTLMDLKQSNARLKDEIELERQLDVMRKGFVANVSHELKTPIAIIQGYAEGLKVDINKESREKYCDVIIDESQRMNRLVLGLLDLSKYESGQTEPKYEVFDLAALIRGMTGRVFADIIDLRLVCRMPERVLAYADSLQIEQVLKSYLENAKSHVNERGEVAISVSEEDESSYKVSVFNTGSHIDKDIMPQIWQSFFRGDKSRQRQSNRFGLGLSIVSAIIRLHKQNCGVYNTDDGVCFWFTVKKAKGTEENIQ